MDRRLRYPTLVGQRFGQLEVIAEGPLGPGGAADLRVPLPVRQRDRAAGLRAAQVG